MATSTFSIFSILSCLKEALKFGHAEDKIWNPVNDKQKEFLDRYYQYALEYMDVFSPEELESIASLDYTEVNDWLKIKGFDIQLRPCTFAVASVLDIFCKWNGEAKPISIAKKTFETSQFGDFETFQGVFIQNRVSVSENIACVRGDNGLTSYFAISENGPCEQFELQEKCTSLSSCFNQLKPYLSNDYYYDPFNFTRDSVHFPKTSVNQQIDISWLVGMNYQGDQVPMIIGEALNQNKLDLDEKGAHAQSAVGLGMMSGSLVSPQRLTIDKPFYFWLTKDGCPVPIFCAYVDEESWIK